MVANNILWTKLSVFGLVLPLVLSVAACSSSDGGDKKGGGDPPGVDGGGDPPPGDPPPGGGLSVDQFCKNYAERAHDCDDSYEVQTVAEECKNANAVRVPKWRDDVIKPTDECVQKQDCKTALSQGGIDACLKKSSAQIAPSAAAKKFCDEFAAAAKKCSGETVPADACLTAAKVYKDDTLGQMTACTSKDCDEVAACVQAAAGLPPQE